MVLYKKTVIEIFKIGNIDVVSVMVKWANQRSISYLCGVQRGLVHIGIQ